MTIVTSNNGALADVRGLNATVAIELCKNGDLKKLDADMAKCLSVQTTKRGLILLSCGTNGNISFPLVPLTTIQAA